LTIGFKIFSPERLFASVALDPQPFRHDAAFCRSFHGLSISFEPSHEFEILQQTFISP
jgi:hypothetical protein